MSENIQTYLMQQYVALRWTSVWILSPRKLDNSDAGFTKWKFMSVATWGEDPRGTWILDILDEIGPEWNNGTIGIFTLILHGTVQIPVYRRNGPRIYNEDYNRIRKTYDVMELSRTNPVEDEYDQDMSEINDIYK